MRNFACPVFLALVLALTFGCGKSETTVVDVNGTKATASSDGSKVTYTDTHGTSTKVETGTTVSEVDLGIAFYPGSTEKAGASFKADTPDEKDTLSIRVTSDDPAKVAEFYKAKVKEANVTSTGNATHDIQMIVGKLDNGGKVTITATRENGKSETDISVATVISKKK